MAQILRLSVMLTMLAGGAVWLRPTSPSLDALDVRFVERAAESGCRHRHGMPVLSPVFSNIMPWLTSVGAAAAAGDFDGDGNADLYVTDSGRGRANRLFRNRGDGTFEHVTRAAEVACGNPHGASMHAIWGDIDNDGDLDLYVVKWAENNALFRNDGQCNFTEIAAAAGVDYWGYGNAATFLDYDRDGRLDILVGNYFCETVVDPASGRPVRNDLWNPASTKIMHETFTHARNAGRNVLFRNLGGGRFADVSEKVGLTTTYWTLAVGSGDLNNDGWPDLYIANDFGPDECYLNTGAVEDPPRFRLVIDPRGHPGVGNDWWKGMNVDMGDVNNDGYLDIYVTNILSARYKTDEGNMLWLNCADAACPGGRGFRNIAGQAGVMDGGWGWGAKFADFNHDGLLDIYAVNGFVTGHPDKTYWFAIQEMVTQTKNQTVDAADWPVMGDRDLSGRERGRLFVQIAPEQTGGLRRKGRSDDHGPRFVECAAEAGITDVFNGRGVALADFDLDGDVDMYVANQGGPSCYYVNETRANSGRSFLRLTLVGRPELAQRVGPRVFASTTSAVGARVTVVAGDSTQIREVQGGMGFASQSEYAVHFGVPRPADVTRLTIWWPSGRTQEITGAALARLIGRHVRVVEGDEAVVVK